MFNISIAQISIQIYMIKCALQLHSRNQIKSNVERGKPEFPEKNLSEQSREPTNSPTYDADSGNLTRATLMGGKRSTTAPTLCSPLSLV